MMQKLYSVNEVKEMIKRGEKLVLAGHESLLKELPEGHWIGGTIPYFMSEKGGEFNTEKIFVNELPDYIKKIKLSTYTEDTISKVYMDAFPNGLSIIIIPASSPVHLSFALNATSYKNFAVTPLIGWISGIVLADAGKVKAKVFFGENKKELDNGAVVMHIELPQNKYAEINIVNMFKQGSGDVITFDTNAFNVTDAYINGKKMNFAEYIKKANIDTKLPLVANYSGAMINISFQAVNEAEKKVDFYAPIFKGVEYKLAAPVGDYVAEFSKKMPTADVKNMFFSCNCILNYLYSGLEGKSTGGVTGPITFGEIAYQLLNQTLAYITIRDVA
jgi:hypothetical protein